MPKRFARTAVAAALLSVSVAFGARAQTSTGQSSTAPGTAPRTPGAPSAATTTPGAPPASTTERSAGKEASALASRDRKFIEKAAKGGIAEVELAKLAEQKGASDQVKQFAKRMEDDHTKANDELKKLASSKGVTLPAELDRGERREIDKLAKKSGADFDREYMKHMVSDHKKDVSEFKGEAKSAKDADVRSFASSTLPTLEQHLDLAKSTEQVAKKEGKSGSSASAGSRAMSTPTQTTPASRTETTS